MKAIKLNKIEKLKEALAPYDYFKRGLERLDPASLEESDRFYLKNFGIYGHKLTPERFILRIRIPGGRLRVEALRRVRDEAKRRGAKLVVTSRAQLELHGLLLKEAVAAARAVEEVGLTSWQTYTDNFRNIVTHPLDGLTEDCLIESYPLLMRMQALFLKQPDFVGRIPRKFNTAIVGSQEQLVSPFGNDLAFVLAKSGGEIGFNIYAGGKNTETARSLNLFVRPEEAVAMFEAVATLYRDEGPRESRSRARLFHMLERTGLESFRNAVLERFGAEASEEGELLVRKAAPRKETPLESGDVAVRYTTRFGETGPEMFDEIFDLCERHGIEEVRLGSDQNIYIPHLPPGTRFRYDSDRYAGIVTCVGSRYCIYSLMDTKKESALLALERCKRLDIVVGLSGCLKGCARHAFSDIGLVGIRTRLYADEVERGIRLYLGAEYTRGGRAGRLILYSVPMRCLNGMIDLIADLFERSGFKDFEHFAHRILNRYSEPALAFWLLLNFYGRYRIKKEEPLLLEGDVPEDEKSYFIARLEASDRPEEREIAEYLYCQEAFPFREAIIHLERACFGVSKGG
ncbi:hypothetical protein [Hydrogenimonas sp.]